MIENRKLQNEIKRRNACSQVFHFHSAWMCCYAKRHEQCTTRYAFIRSDRRNNMKYKAKQKNIVREYASSHSNSSMLLHPSSSPTFPTFRKLQGNPTLAHPSWAPNQHGTSYTSLWMTHAFAKGNVVGLKQNGVCSEPKKNDSFVSLKKRNYLRQIT